MQDQDEYGAEESADQASERVQALGYKLSRLAKEQVGIRQSIEDRWLADLEQYMGHYDAETLERLKKNGGSQAFVNITRPKTTAAEARLSDMLFPTDDSNWAIQPTPNPELQKLTADMGLAGMDEQGNPITKADYAKQIMKEARDKAEAMTREIEDQLVEAKYHQVARDVIHDACLFGTGILKGPVVINRTRKSWKKLQGSVYELDIVDEYRPGVERVNVWDWFPDMTAVNMSECNFFFERRYISKKELIALSKRPGYLTDQIKLALMDSVNNNAMQAGNHTARMRELSGVQANIGDNRYELWEYHGHADTEDLQACGCEMDDDVMQEHDAVVVMVNGRVIKADLNPLETGEAPYSVFHYENDDTSIFGFGVPYLLRNEQRITNAAWRMTLDNAALSTGPQIIVNRELVTPSDGSWDLKAKKVWWLNDPERNVGEVFETHDIESHQAELTAIYNMAKEMADEAPSIPQLAQGEAGDAPETATGRSILMNASNIVFRNRVKAFDDGITRPFITRMYDWNMQNSDKEDIKGDYEIDARGSSALLVKETQTQALMALIDTSERPAYAELFKHAELLRKTVQAQHINPDDIVKTDVEIEAEKNAPKPEQQQQQAMFELQLQELQTKIDKLASEKDKVDAEKTESFLRGMYSSMQAAGIAQNTTIAAMGDELYKSAGGKDFNGGVMANWRQGGVMPEVQANTSPGFPALPDGGEPVAMPQEQMPMPTPGQGAMDGIETMQNEGLQ